MKRSFLLIVLYLYLSGCGEQPPGKGELAHVQTEENILRSHIQTFVDSCWNSQDLSKLTEISEENFTKYLNGIRVANNQKEMQAHMNIFFRAFPDLEIRLRGIYAEDNRVFMQWTASGTNTGIFGEFAATGKKIKVSGLSHFHFNRNGKLSSENAVYNELELLQQLGYTLNPPNLE